MTQRNVERLIGRLITDDAFRERFIASPQRALESVATEGWDLNPLERAALAKLDVRELSRIARGIDPRIRKVSLNPEPPATDTPGDAEGKERAS